MWATRFEEEKKTIPQLLYYNIIVIIHRTQRQIIYNINYMI